MEAIVKLSLSQICLLCLIEKWEENKKYSSVFGKLRKSLHRLRFGLTMFLACSHLLLSVRCLLQKMLVNGSVRSVCPIDRSYPVFPSLQYPMIHHSQKVVLHVLDWPAAISDKHWCLQRWVMFVLHFVYLQPPAAFLSACNQFVHWIFTTSKTRGFVTLRR